MKKTIIVILVLCCFVILGLLSLSKSVVWKQTDGVKQSEEEDDFYGVSLEAPIESTGEQILIEEGDILAPNLNEAKPETGLKIAAFEKLATGLESVQHSHKKREWIVEFDSSLKRLASDLNENSSPVVLDFSQILGLRVELSAYKPFDDNRGVFQGRVIGKDQSSVVLGIVNNAMAGSIKEGGDGATFEIRDAGNGRQYIAEVDVTAFGECHVCSALHNEQ